jgi:hypothetical protein
MTGRAIGRGLKAAGLGIRRENLTGIINALKGIARADVQLRFLGLNRIPNVNRLPLALTRMIRKTSFLVEVRGFSRVTGNDFIQFINVSLDAPLSRLSMQNMAIEAVALNQKKYELDIIGALLVGGVRAGPLGVL